MAREARSTNLGLTDVTPPGEIRRFSFFRLIEALENESRSVRIGHQGPPSGEAVRLRPSIGLGFAATDIEGVETLETESGKPRYQITVNFLGLYGASSPLPTSYAEDILWAAMGSEPSEAVRDFLDLFHHRVLSLFYRAWVKYRHYTQYEEGGGDRFSRSLESLLGLGLEGIRDRTPSTPDRMIRYAGLLQSRIRSAAGLEALLGDAFEGIPVGIRQCTPAWVPVSDSEKVHLGAANSRLGKDLTLGERVPCRTEKFRIRIGPMNRDEFRKLVPGGAWHDKLSWLTEFYVSDPLTAELELVLTEGEVPALSLDPEEGLGLGRLSWLTPNEESGACVRFNRLGDGSND